MIGVGFCRWAVVTNPTHKFGNILDLKITKKDTKLCSHTVDEILSHHKNEHKHLETTIAFEIYQSQEITNVDINQIKNNIKLNDKMVEICDTNKLVSPYNNKLPNNDAQKKKLKSQ